MKFISILAVILFFCIFLNAQASFSGDWESTYGLIKLTQKDKIVTGFYFYSGNQCSISGVMEGNRLTFSYQEPNNIKGEGWFELSTDGKSFTGKWKTKEMQIWGDWSGKRVQLLQLSETKESKDFSGLWNTSFGYLRLVQEREAVHGIYSYSDGSKVQGKVQGDQLTFQYKEPSTEGEGSFILSPDGNSFKGKWRAKNDPIWKPWDGTRVFPVANRIWLVVIEANWENSLNEREYNFGSMLKIFFSRVPEVQVRHRFFYDQNDITKWCREVSYLAEPTVVVISSHGTPQGVKSGTYQTTPSDFYENLRYASNVSLLHFASCMTMNGDFAEKILAGMGKNAHFPISGYTTNIDWAASAVLEFMYYDLLLVRHLSPTEAVQQLYNLMPFAGNKLLPEAPFKSLGIRIISPGNGK